MIIDKIENYKLYDFGSTWNKAFDFIKMLNENAEEKKYILDGENMFVGIDTYKTKIESDAVLESHKEYVDIQLLLSGKEKLKYSNISDLEINKEYNIEKDVVFYKKKQSYTSEIIIEPGIFCVFFPEDAHMPQLRVCEESDQVKKVVVKINKNLL